MARNRQQKRLNKLKNEVCQRQSFDRTEYLQETPQQKKAFHLKDLKKVVPITETQEEFFQAWYDGDSQGYTNDVLIGHAMPACGKTLISCYLGMQSVLDEHSPYEKLVIIRSVVPSRDIGFMPGSEDDKVSFYKTPYKQIFDKLFPWSNSFINAEKIGLVDFEITSFLRGTTFENCIVVVDEVQNMTEVELETVLTRLGRNSRLIAIGDHYNQNDLGSKSGFGKILPILKHTPNTVVIEFGLEDIVRSGWVKNFVIAKYKSAQRQNNH